MKSSLIVLLITGIVFFSHKGHGQNMELSLQLGGSYYSGDMDAPEFSTNLKNIRFALGLGGKYNFSSKFGIRANMTFGKLRGDDSMSSADWQIKRNLSFETNLFEFAALAEYKIFSFDLSNGWTISPYAAAGVAVFRFNPTTELEGLEYELQPLGTEGQGLDNSHYSLTQLSIPFGGGIHFDFGSRFFLFGEILGRKTFTDYIDDLSTNYVAVEELNEAGFSLAAELAFRSDELAGFDPLTDFPVTGDQRGMPDVKDYYFSGMIGFGIYFDGFFKRSDPSTDCYKF